MGFPQLQSHLQALPSGDRTVGLTGVSGASTLATLLVAVSLALSGVSGTTAVGNVSNGLAPEVTRPRVVQGPFPFPKSTPAFYVSSIFKVSTGVQGDTAVGVAGISTAIALSGVSATSTNGLVDPLIPGIGSPRGVVGASGLGSLGVVVVLSETGVQASTAITPPIATVTYVDRPHRLDGPFPFLTGGMFQFQSPARPVNPLSQASTIGLLGLVASGANGTVTPVFAETLSGRTATPAVGSVAPVDSIAAVGNAGTGAVGSLGMAQALSGVAATSGVGAVSPNISIALVGVQASASINSVGAQTNQDVSIGLTGIAMTGGSGVLSPSTTVATTGVTSTNSVGTLTPNLNFTVVGISETIFEGSLLVSQDLALIGQQAATALGTPISEASRLLTTQEGLGQLGALAISAGSTVILVGVEASAIVGTLASADPIILSLIGRFDDVIDLEGKFG